jgi:hypothetical protein
MPIRTLTATWAGDTGSATAVVTLDTDLVTTQPGGAIPIAQIQDLKVTVQGAQAGNGSFGKADFSALRFYSSFPLDFSQPLLGQTGSDPAELPFGAADAQGRAGDFNLVSTGTGPAPDGVSAFSLATNGKNDPSDFLKITAINP